MGILDSAMDYLKAPYEIVGGALGIGADKKKSKKKKVMVNGKEVEVPEGYDESLYNEQLALEDQMSTALEGQYQTALGREKEVAKQEESSVNALRRNAAQALATQRGLVSGGRGLGAARSVAESASGQEAQFRSGFAQQMADAREKAALALSEKTLAQGELLDAKAARAKGPAEAQGEINRIKSQYEGTMYTAMSDYHDMARELNALAASETNPAKAKLYADAADKARRGAL
jgi:hypothetical protein